MNYRYREPVPTEIYLSRYIFLEFVIGGNFFLTVYVQSGWVHLVGYMNSIVVVVGTVRQSSVIHNAIHEL